VRKPVAPRVDDAFDRAVLAFAYDAVEAFYVPPYEGALVVLPYAQVDVVEEEPHVVPRRVVRVRYGVTRIDVMLSCLLFFNL